MVILLLHHTSKSTWLRHKKPAGVNKGRKVSEKYHGVRGVQVPGNFLKQHIKWCKSKYFCILKKNAFLLIEEFCKVICDR